MDKNKNAIEQLKKGIMSYVDIKLNKLAFVKTEIGVVSGVGTTQGNKVDVKGAIYDNVLSVGNIIFPTDCVVYLFIPNAQYSNMFILGQLDDTPANIVGGTINIGNGAFTVDGNGNLIANNITANNNGVIGGWDIANNALISTGSFATTLLSSNISDLDTFFLLFFDNDTPSSPIFGVSASEMTVNTLDSSFYSNVLFDNFVRFNDTVRFYGNVLNSTGGVVFTSDKNAKYDIESLNLEKSSNFIYSLNPVEYKFKEGTSNRKHHGLISQEVKEAMREDDWGLYIDETFNSELELNDDGSIKKTKKDEGVSYPKGLRYDELISDLIATCQYQKQQIDSQQQQIDLLTKQTEELKSLITIDETKVKVGGESLDGINETNSIDN